MSDWFSKAQKFVDTMTENLVEQANSVQNQMEMEQKKVRDEAAQTKQQLEGEVQLPWETNDDSLAILTQDVMEKILSLSLTDQNFTIVPPKVELMPFLFPDHVPTAMRLLNLDANLARMHAKVCD
jgi:ribosomal protein L9